MYINNLITGTMTLGSGGSNDSSMKTIIIDIYGEHEHNVTGELNVQWMLDNGYYINDPEEGMISPGMTSKIYIGSTVTGIGGGTFSAFSGDDGIEFHLENFATKQQVIENGENWGMANIENKCFCSDGILIWDEMEGWMEPEES